MPDPARLLFVALGLLAAAAGRVAAERPTAEGASGYQPGATDSVWAATWSSVPTDLRHVYPMVWIEDRFNKYGNIGDAGGALTNPARIAEQLRRLPQSRRALHLWYFRDGFFSNEADRILGAGTRSPWPQVGGARAESRWKWFLANLALHGVDPDVLILDNEEPGLMTSWHLSQAQMASITNDRRFPKAATGTMPSQGAVPGFPTVARADSAQLEWNATVTALATEALVTALWSPARAQFPRVKGSNYQGSIVRSGDAAADLNGHEIPKRDRWGTASAPALYGLLDQIVTRCSIDPNDPTRVGVGGNERIVHSAWFSFLADMQAIRAVKRSDEAPPHAWIASPRWTGEGSSRSAYPADPRYHAEMVRHAALLGVEMFIVWNPPLEPGWVDSPEEKARRHREAMELDAVLNEINAHIRGTARAAVEAERLSWRSSFVVTRVRLEDARGMVRVAVAPGTRGVRTASGRELIIPKDAVGAWFEGRYDDFKGFEPIPETEGAAAPGDPARLPPG